MGRWAAFAYSLRAVKEKSKRPLLYAMTAFVVLFNTVPPAYAQSQKELKQLDESLKQTESILAISREKRVQTLQDLQAIEIQISERTIRFDQTRVKTDILEKQAGLLEDELGKLQQEFERARKYLATLLESAYLMGRESALKVALSQKGTQHIARLNHYTRSLSSARQNQLDALISLQQQLEQKNRLLTQQGIQLEKLTTALEEDQRYLSQLRENRQAMLKQLDKSIASRAQEVDHLRLRKAKLEKVLADITRRQRVRAERKRAQEKRLQAPKNRPPEKKSPRPVQKNGNLPMPTSARIIAHFGEKREKSGLPWSGILMEGAEGTDVRAVSSGEVVYADWLQGYGQMIIVDHGQGLMSLYGHNKRIHRTVGDQVKQSDIIASMGNTAGLKKAALYFEIRKNGVAQDPLNWCRG